MIDAVTRHERGSILLVAILLVAGALRLYHLDQSSLWYDEVVTMRLARTENPLALINLLGQIDATRAPLHPLVLQAWVTIFGPSDSSGRFLSVLCGLMTIGIVYWIGVTAFDRKTALWASWLCAVSPLLVYYSREARMYMWLVLTTCLAWGFLLSHCARAAVLETDGLRLLPDCVVYSHPLGLLMAWRWDWRHYCFGANFRSHGVRGASASSRSSWVLHPG